MDGVRVDLLREGTRVDVFDGPVKVSKACCSAIVLIRSGKDAVIVDPGAMGYADELLAALKRLGVSPGRVNKVVNTHMHLDHTYNDYLFDKAVIYTPTSVWHPENGNRVEMYPSTTDPGVEGVGFIDTPGHMEKHISVLAEAAGRRIVVAGDAVRESILDEGKAPARYSDAGAYMESLTKVFAVADEIIPGHGPVIKGARLQELKRKVLEMTAHR
jgi:glyoxylase-like metal-dependent hydrolase (beta-lactamase superfamily II)